MDYLQSLGCLSLGSRLKRLSDRLVQDVVTLYQSQGIELHPTYMPLFNLLSHRGALSVTEAAEQLGVSHPAVSKIARKMLTDGWLSKASDPEDIRRQLLTLTPQSEALLEQITPVWHEIKLYLDQLMAAQQHPLLDALNEFEAGLDKQGFFQPVLERMQNRRQTQGVSILGWDERYRDDFRRLNMDWLSRYFEGQLIDLDREALNNPESYYLARGGYIWFAINEAEEAVGCVALVRQADGQFEISKMGVDVQWQRAGIGRKLLQSALDKARSMGANEVYLETSSKLHQALHLYRNMGFRQTPHPQGESRFSRSDIYMVLSL